MFRSPVHCIDIFERFIVGSMSAFVTAAYDSIAFHELIIMLVNVLFPACVSRYMSRALPLKLRLENIFPVAFPRYIPAAGVTIFVRKGLLPSQSIVIPASETAEALNTYVPSGCSINALVT